jgi:hypothetical protein
MFNTNYIETRPTVNHRRIAKILRLSALRRHFWHKACALDDINPRSAFVTFSKENPYGNVWIDRAYRLMNQLMQQEAQERQEAK